MITYTSKWDGVFECYETEFKFSIKLIQNGEKIEGKITDYCGKATFSGTFIGSQFNFLKSYYSGLSAGAQFMYVGDFNPSKRNVSGIWYYPNYPPHRGSFWLNLP